MYLLSQEHRITVRKCDHVRSRRKALARTQLRQREIRTAVMNGLRNSEKESGWAANEYYFLGSDGQGTLREQDWKSENLGRFEISSARDRGRRVVR